MLCAALLAAAALGAQVESLRDLEQRGGWAKLGSGILLRPVRLAPDYGGARSPRSNDDCVVDFVGRLLDGTVFDSTQRRTPVQMPPAGGVQGWGAALQLMCEGDKWRVALPPELAYGEQGVPGKIPESAPVEFEVSLHRVADPLPEPGDVVQVLSISQLELLFGPGMAGSLSDAAAARGEVLQASGESGVLLRLLEPAPSAGDIQVVPAAGVAPTGPRTVGMPCADARRRAAELGIRLQPSAEDEL
eukprot:TRINITY_DN12809_c0_g1_i1.p2 TRINITY_DN12809_c0_g1~~TRINITY_DN12809_c0_g1_i1.p2  ORF type:complete len:274 (+),score=107.53 TRINITY_DN12809_c0_g1_i1:86-823(+)